MLTSSQLCVLFPQGLGGDRCVDNDDTRKERPIARCLFGRPDPLETRKLLEEELAANRERMVARWGIDILTGQFETADSSTVTSSRPTPYTRQTRISDFWRSKKASSVGKSLSTGSELRSGSAQAQQ